MWTSRENAASAPFRRRRYDTQFENRHELESIAELTHLPKGGTVMVQRARRIVSVLRVGYKRSADSRHIVELLEPVTLGTQYLAKRDREDEDPLAIVSVRFARLMTIAIAVVRSASNHPAACCGDTYSLSAISEVTAVSHSAAPARRMRYCWRMDLRARSASSGSCADSSAEYRRIKIVHAPAVAHVLLDKVTADQRHELRPYRSVG